MMGRFVGGGPKILGDWIFEEVDEEGYGKIDSSNITSLEMKSFCEDKDKHL